jgi:hypothetical protein
MRIDNYITRMVREFLFRVCRVLIDVTHYLRRLLREVNDI